MSEVPPRQLGTDPSGTGQPDAGQPDADQSDPEQADADTVWGEDSWDGQEFEEFSSADETPAPAVGSERAGHQGNPADSPEFVDGKDVVRLPPPLTAHEDAGLDYARAAARAASKVPGQPLKRRKNPTSDAAKRERRRRGGRNSSGAWPDDRDPQLLGSSLERLVAAAGWSLDLRVQKVFGRWAELVGDDVAEHCTPESLVDGRLQVRTSSTAWATQLTLLAPTVVKRLNEELGHGTVTVIDVHGPHLPTWKKGLLRSKGRGPRDTYG